jgi:hypothetical protein
MVICGLDLFVCEEAALDHIVHNMHIKKALGRLNKGSIQSNRATAVREKVSHALVIPSRFEVWGRSGGTFKSVPVNEAAAREI